MVKSNRATCDYLAKQIEAKEWAQNDAELDEEVKKAFEIHLKALRIKYNSHFVIANESNWDTLKHCLRHLSQEDVNSVKSMLATDSGFDKIQGEVKR